MTDITKLFDDDYAGNEIMLPSAKEKKAFRRISKHAQALIQEMLEHRMLDVNVYQYGPCSAQHYLRALHGVVELVVTCEEACGKAKQFSSGISAALPMLNFLPLLGFEFKIMSLREKVYSSDDRAVMAEIADAMMNLAEKFEPVASKYAEGGDEAMLRSALKAEKGNGAPGGSSNGGPMGWA